MNLLRHKPRQSGFTLVEVIIVVGLIATTFVYLIPNIASGPNPQTVNTKLGRLASDFRVAFDTSVLSGRTHRLAFELASGDYWLETTLAKDFSIGGDKLQLELTPEQEKEAIEEFKEEMEEYRDLMGDEIQDVDNDRTILPSSPVIEAEEALKPAEWLKVENTEWGPRSLGEELIIKKIHAEHHEEAIDITEVEPERAFAYVYIFPSGIEKAMFHLYYRKYDNTIDEEISGYTVITEPLEGVIEVRDGIEEIEIGNE